MALPTGKPGDQEQQRAEAIRDYARILRSVIDEWASPHPGDAAWLMYSANYLMNTGETRWAIDPVTLNWRVKDAPPVDASRLASNLDFVLLTHTHGDHFDLDLIRSLRDAEIKWVIPAWMQTRVMEECGLRVERIITPKPGQSLDLDGLRITPFESLHWEPPAGDRGEPRGVPEMGYQVENGRKNWVIPGDIRDYDAGKLPVFGKIDLFFAHLWLGRKSALMREPPLLQKFCQFCVNFQPHAIALTHLQEWGRAEDDMWGPRHASQAQECLGQTLPGCRVVAAQTGQKILL